MNKKLICILLCASILITIGGCSPMSESLKAIEGKDGVFAIMETSQGNIVLFRDTCPLSLLSLHSVR